MNEFDTPRRTGGYEFVESYDVAASVTIKAGALVARDGDGNAVPYATTAEGTVNALVALGRCDATADNSDGAAGDIQVRVRTGVFRWANDVSNKAVTKANIGAAVYGHDDHTIRSDARTGGNKDNAAKAGRLIAVDDDGAWVATGIPFLW
ncbi:hypothetical protein [Ruegeria sp.]|uniref:hypothetical protein n=1 Tax=Ruegeria sp. TaxID=1879320 RepID=UPI003B58E136